MFLIRLTFWVDFLLLKDRPLSCLPRMVPGHEEGQWEKDDASGMSGHLSSDAVCPEGVSDWPPCLRCWSLFLGSPGCTWEGPTTPPWAPRAQRNIFCRVSIRGCTLGLARWREPAQGEVWGRGADLPEFVHLPGSFLSPRLWVFRKLQDRCLMGGIFGC